MIARQIAESNKGQGVYAPEEKTVFILGAGASWHYGYPTGEELVKRIIEKAEYAKTYFGHAVRNRRLPQPKYIENLGGWLVAHDLCSALKAGLEQVNPLVIDYYLGWNSKLEAIGRLLIAWVILESESIYDAEHGNINRKKLLQNSPYEAEHSRANALNLRLCKDDWCRFVIHQLAINCEASSDLLKNNVQFITFNYDVSLERALYDGLRHIQLFQPADVERFFLDARIMHVYGKVQEDFKCPPQPRIWEVQRQNPNRMDQAKIETYILNFGELLDYVYPASQGIRVIDPNDKGSDEGVIRSARQAIEEAQHVYILVFDENNCDRLGLRAALGYQRQVPMRVRFTNFRNVNRVNKRVGKITFDNDGQFTATGADVFQKGTMYYERSVRNVYEALELDFD
jgi:hypothetical protein